VLQVTKFEQSPWLRLLAPLLAGLLIAAVYQGASRAAPAQRNAVYLISDSDGYGLVDCIVQKRECGKIVADGCARLMATDRPSALASPKM